MGRGVSAGGGQSSLGYLFGNGESTTSAQPAKDTGVATTTEPSPPKPATATAAATAAAAAAASPASEKGIPAGVNSNNLNNYQRSDGQNCGNFLTDRPSTKVHAAPGGGSSLGYLFGDGSNSRE